MLYVKLIALSALTCSAIFPQSPGGKKAFEAAVIKTSDANTQGGRLTPSQNSIIGVNVPLRLYVEWAHEVRPELLFGPASLDAHFDITAKTDGPTPLGDLRLMLQTLLQERFHLISHRETRTLPVYALVVSKGGVKHLTPAPQEGSRSMEMAKGPTGEQIWRFHRYPMSLFVHYVGRFARDRPVVDMTGLTETFEFSFNEPPRSADIPLADYAFSDLFPELSSQLGLSIVPRSAPFEVFVVDAADRSPSEN